jgi:hypothetical protein
VGWILPKNSKRKPVSQSNKLNNEWIKAIFLFVNLYKLGNNNHKLALKDYYQSISDSGADSFLYAYRALEDICRAITGKDKAQDGWNDMHIKLGTVAEDFKEITSISEAVRHGNINESMVVGALKNKKLKKKNTTHSINSQGYCQRNRENLSNF